MTWSKDFVVYCEFDSVLRVDSEELVFFVGVINSEPPVISLYNYLLHRADHLGLLLGIQKDPVEYGFMSPEGLNAVDIRVEVVLIL